MIPWAPWQPQRHLVSGCETTAGTRRPGVWRACQSGQVISPAHFPGRRDQTRLNGWSSLVARSVGRGEGQGGGQRSRVTGSWSDCFCSGPVFRHYGVPYLLLVLEFEIGVFFLGFIVSSPQRFINQFHHLSELIHIFRLPAE